MSDFNSSKASADHSVSVRVGNYFGWKNRPGKNSFLPAKTGFDGQKLVLTLVCKITIKSNFVTTKQVRNIVLEIEILICVCLRRTKSTIQT